MWIWCIYTALILMPQPSQWTPNKALNHVFWIENRFLTQTYAVACQEVRCTWALAFLSFFKRMFCKTICKESCHAGFKQKSETLGICSNHHVRCLYPGRSLSFQTFSELFQHILKSMATPIRQESTGNLYQYIPTPSFPKEANSNSH